MKFAQRVEEQNTYSRSGKGDVWWPRPQSSYPAQFSSQKGLHGPWLPQDPSTQPTHFKENSYMSGSYPKWNPQSPRLNGPRLPSIPNPNSQFSPLTSPLIHRTTPTYKRLFDAELQAKIEKGLCFRCDTKFSPGH